MICVQPFESEYICSNFILNPNLIYDYSGFELVNKGITKSQANLPELGLKDVYPTGSWLEQKQIQAAIDARKHLISAERIEKR